MVRLYRSSANRIGLILALERVVFEADYEWVVDALEQVGITMGVEVSHCLMMLACDVLFDLHVAKRFIIFFMILSFFNSLLLLDITWVNLMLLRGYVWVIEQEIVELLYICNLSLESEDVNVIRLRTRLPHHVRLVKRSYSIWLNTLDSLGKEVLQHIGSLLQVTHGNWLST